MKDLNRLTAFLVLIETHNPKQFCAAYTYLCNDEVEIHRKGGGKAAMFLMDFLRPTGEQKENWRGEPINVKKFIEI